MDYTKWLTKTALLLALTLVFQMIGFPQPVTGPLINMMLFISATISGLLGGILIGALTPWIAFVRGILPAPLAPMIPFIMAGNAVLVVSYFGLKRVNQYLAVIVASVIKFAVLALAVNFLVEVPEQIAAMMQLPQLLTALAGGVLALVLLRLLEDKIEF